MSKDPDLPKDPSLSYRYWVGPRGDGVEKAAPPPMPRKLSQEELASLQRVDSKGSAWNQGGTWEEKSLNEWARRRLGELLQCSCAATIGAAEYTLSTELETCMGDTTIVVVRNKRRHGYLLDIRLKLAGLSSLADAKEVSGSVEVHEATYGEVDDWQLDIQVDVSKGKLSDAEALQAHKEAKQLLPLLQQQMRVFETELRAR